MPELPTPEKMKAVLTEVSEAVQKAERRLAALAEKYGVHGDHFFTGSHWLRLTRRGSWGVFVTRGSSDDILDHITGARIECKLDFLRVVSDLEERFLKKIAEVYKEAVRCL